MGIFNFFQKNKLENFKIRTALLDYPKEFDPEITTLVQGLSLEETELLHKICNHLQIHIESLYIFWIKDGFGFTKDLIRRDKTAFYKSCFELLMIDWVVVTKEFKTKGIGQPVGQTLWWIIYYSLNEIEPSIFNGKTFSDFGRAYENRKALYPKLLNDYHIGGNESQLALQNMYVLLIETPLTNDMSDIELSSLYGMLINGILSLDAMGNMKRLASFSKFFQKGFYNFSKALSDTII